MIQAISQTSPLQQRYDLQSVLELMGHGRHHPPAGVSNKPSNSVVIIASRPMRAVAAKKGIVFDLSDRDFAILLVDGLPILRQKHKSVVQVGRNV